MTRRLVLGGGLAAVALGVAGCTSSGFPADPDGTLDRVRGGTLRAGAVHHPPYVDVSTGSAEPTGTEADLVRRFAQELDARVDWTAASEEALVTALERGDLDLMVGGLTTKSAWSKKVALTRGYAEDVGPDGEPVKLAMAVALGENQMLGRLEEYLDRHGEEVPA